MGGTDNLAGIDFQIAYCVYRVLKLVSEGEFFEYIEFEGLDEEGQDFKLQKSADAAELVQVKKKGEGYLWTPSLIKPVIEKFLNRFDEANTYVFFSDGSFNPELISLRESMENKHYSSDGLLSIAPSGSNKVTFLSFLARCDFQTRQFVSSYPQDPAHNIRESCKLILAKAPFLPLLDVEQSYKTLWMFLFEQSRINGTLSYNSIYAYMDNAGFIGTFSGFPAPRTDAYNRSQEVKEIRAKHFANDVLFVYGLSGVGKSTAVARSLIDYQAMNRVLWFSVSPAYDSRYFRQALAVFLETSGRVNLALPLRDSRINDLEAIDAVLTRVELTIVFDSVKNRLLYSNSYGQALFEKGKHQITKQN